MALVLKQYILPQMEAMTEEKFLSRLQKRNQNDQEANHPVRCHAASLALLDELLILWENKETGWEAAIQERIEQVSANWLDYML